jgi:hypothetical protein
VASGALDPSHTGNPNWGIVGAGDFNGDGFDDLLFLNEDSHELVIWFMAAGPAESGPRRLTGDFVSPTRLGETGRVFSIGGPR